MPLKPYVTRILRDKDIVKASKLFGIEEAILKRLNDQHLLDSDYIRCLLIKSDYEYLMRGLKYLVDQRGAYTTAEVMAALKKEYKVKDDELKAILHGNRNSTMYFCRKCGIRVTKNTHIRTGGLCNVCFADLLEL